MHYLNEKLPLTTLERIQELCSSRKIMNLSWASLTDRMNAELSLNYSESWYRKNFKQNVFEKMIKTYKDTADIMDNSNTEDETDMSVQLRELELKRITVSDLVSQNKQYIRRLSREQTLLEIAKNYAEVMNKEKILHPFEKISCDSVKYGLLLLSDWHYGLEISNPWNIFNPEVCKYRVETLLSKVISIIKKRNIKELTVLNLGDMIAGRIHSQIRIESRFDVISQTMDVSEILVEFLYTLSKYCKLSFYSCSDNHSRLEPNKKESLDLESLTRIIHWHVEKRLQNHPNIQVISQNEFGEDIITCNVHGHDIIAVHGDKDNPESALENLTLFTKRNYEMLCMAHRHHFFLDEINETLVIGNPSLIGPESHSVKHRLTSKPSQLFIVVGEDVCEDIIPIKV